MCFPALCGKLNSAVFCEYVVDKSHGIYLLSNVSISTSSSFESCRCSLRVFLDHALGFRESGNSNEATVLGKSKKHLAGDVQRHLL